MQTANGASQAASSVWVRRGADFSAWMKELEFCRKRETGRQDWNVELLRKSEKNWGHEDLVKLLPRDVSNAEGRDVVTTVTEGKVVPDVVVGVTDESCLVDRLPVDVDFAEFDVSVVEAADSAVELAADSAVVVDSTSSPTCLRLNTKVGRGGGALWSICISPLAASSFKRLVSSTLGV